MLTSLFRYFWPKEEEEKEEEEEEEVMVYVLELARGKFYVGKTTNVSHRYDQHCAGEAAAWTRLYPPRRILHTQYCTNMFDENTVTKEWMLAEGIDNVRGGVYTQLTLPPWTRRALQAELWDVEDKCRRCGSADHFIAQCSKEEKNGEEEEEEEEEEKEEHDVGVKRTRHGKKWSGKEEEELLDEVQRMSLEDIALKHGRSEGGIQWRLRHLALELVATEGLSVEEAAARVHVPVSVLVMNHFKKRK